MNKQVVTLFLLSILLALLSVDASQILFQNNVEADAFSFGAPLSIPAANIRYLVGKHKPRRDERYDLDIYAPDTDTHIHVGGNFSADRKMFQVEFVSFKVNGIGPGVAGYAAAYPRGRNLEQRADGRYNTEKLPASLAAQKKALIVAQIGF
jgi:hypothetical protein